MGFNQIGFIGCGNMGSALARACARRTKAILLADHHMERVAALAGELDVGFCDNATIAGNCDLIFLGMKPQAMAAALEELAPVLGRRRDRFVVLTMAAGVTISAVRSMLGLDCPVIRIMPNTPVSIGQGMILWCSLGLSEDEKLAFRQLLGEAGELDELSEALIDAGSAVAGCGPAFVYAFIEALADGGVACGLPRDKAQRYGAQMLVGAAKLVLESGQHPGVLKDAVCSPGGSTIQGVRALEEGGFRGVVMDAVISAFEKTVELGK